MSKEQKLSQWIINKRADVLWIIGSVTVTYFFILAYFCLSKFNILSIASSQLFIYLTWIIIFDGTHVFATYTRTYFDKEFRTNNKPLIYGGLLLFLVGPLYMLSFYMWSSPEQIRAAFILFNRFGMLYAYYHLIRQHWGFMRLYNQKSGGITLKQEKLEYFLLWLGTLLPLAFHNLYHYVPFGLAEKNMPSLDAWRGVAVYLLMLAGVVYLLSILISRSQKHSHAYGNIIAKVLLISSLSVTLFIILGITNLLKLTTIVIGLAFVSVLLKYLVFCFDRSSNFKFSQQKTLLLTIVIITHCLLLSLPVPYIVSYACLAMFHNVQYHRIVYFHNHNKYIGNRKQYGMAEILTRNLVLFIVLSLSFNFVSTLPRASLNYISMNETLFYMIAAAFWGIAFHHYVFDAIIWRPSKDRKTAANLKLIQA